MKRKHKYFYWLKTNADTWVVGQWDESEGCWWLCGTDNIFNDDDFLEISEYAITNYET